MSFPEPDPRRGRGRAPGLFYAAFFLVAFSIVPRFPAFANPFYGDSDEKAPAAPVVRPGPFTGAQGRIKDALAGAFDRFGAGGSQAWIAVLGTAFLYGILHAAGPGHRKTVIFSLFLGRDGRAWEPLAAGFFSAGVHAASGGLVLLVLSALRGVLVSFSHTETLIAWMDGITLVLMFALVLVLLGKALARAIRGGVNLGPGQAPKGSGLYSVLFLSSVVPCPGAIMVLMFALYRKAVVLGAAAFLAMSVGMGLVVSAAAYLAWFGRARLFSRLKSRERTVTRVSACLEALSYLIILGFAVYTARPFLASLVP